MPEGYLAITPAVIAGFSLRFVCHPQFVRRVSMSSLRFGRLASCSHGALPARVSYTGSPCRPRPVRSDSGVAWECLEACFSRARWIHSARGRPRGTEGVGEPHPAGRARECQRHSPAEARRRHQRCFSSRRHRHPRLGNPRRTGRPRLWPHQVPRAPQDLSGFAATGWPHRQGRCRQPTRYPRGHLSHGNGRKDRPSPLW